MKKPSARYHESLANIFLIFTYPVLSKALIKPFIFASHKPLEFLGMVVLVNTIQASYQEPGENKIHSAIVHRNMSVFQVLVVGRNKLSNFRISEHERLR